MPGGEGDGSNDLAPQKIKWDIVREFPGGDEVLDTNYVFDFDCILSAVPGVDAAPKILYFKYGVLFRYTVQLLCLSNCTDTDDWNGIQTINEGSWKTNVDCEGSEDTDNPVLASFPDGPYKINVFSYAYDITLVDTASINIELHNFAPVVEEVIVSGSTGEIYHAEWTASGLTPQLNVTVDIPVSNSEILDVTVIFSEPM
ncbi:MAG: hypothetical protein K8R76_06625, partial [Candidatus Aegiribacteria sp.]|nr:hypothetical protein [Candidatus Aegiribacteria sp.]